ncbi:MAG: LysR family transcriptional regulator [Clostridia bacterium]|nr:LysR family transcriptional regulator [Clostridia bacterium]
MNLNRLEYFVAVAETLSFTKAANRCFISQTAMTQQIQALEKDIGVALFLRDKHHVSLTPAGRVYLGEAQKILARASEATRLAKLAAAGEEGEIVVGFPAGFGESDGTDLLSAFRSAHPGIRIKLVRDTVSGLMVKLEAGECAAAFVISSESVHRKYPDAAFRFLKNYPLMAVLPLGHPLAGRGFITYADLAPERFIIMQPGDRSRDEMEEVMLIYRRGGFVPEIAAFEREPETMLLMVSLGLGVCFLPEYIVRNRRNPGIAVVPLAHSDGSAETVGFEVACRPAVTGTAAEKLLSVVAPER